MVFDELKHFMSMPPTVQVAIPSFMVRARHGHRSASCTPDDFWPLVGKANMLGVGFSEEHVSQVQHRMVAERVLSCLKAAPHDDARTALEAFLGPTSKGPLDIPGDLALACQEVLKVVTCESVQDAKELKDAMASLSKNCVGLVLDQHPIGRKFVQLADARVGHLEDQRSRLEQLKALVAGVDDGAGEIRKKLVAAVPEIAKLSNDLDIPQEVLTSLEHTAGKLREETRKLLQALLAETATPDLLHSLLALRMVYAVRHNESLANAGAWTCWSAPAIRHFQASLAIRGKSDVTYPEACAFMKEAHLVCGDEQFNNFVGEEAVESWMTYVDTSLESSQEYTLSEKCINRHLQPHCGRLVKLLEQCAKLKLLPDASMIELCQQEKLVLDEAAQQSASIITSAAADLGDDKLDKQGRCTIAFASCMSDAIAAMIWWGSCANQDEKAISAERVSLISALRVHRVELKGLLKGIIEADDKYLLKDLFMPTECDCWHPAFFDSAQLDMDSLAEALELKIELLLTPVGDVWMLQATQLCKQVQEWMPIWEPRCDSLLGEADEDQAVRHALLTNKNYMDLSSASVALAQMLSQIKILHSDAMGSIFPAELMKHLECSKISSIRTVTVTFALFSLTKGLPKIEDVKARAAEAKKTMQSTEKKCQMPDCIIEALKAIASAA